MKNFGLVYRDILTDVMSRGMVEMNRRTNTHIRMLPEGISFALHLNDNVLPTCGLRRTKPWHAAAETAWCLLGHDHTDWLRKYTKVWDPFCDVVDGSYKLPQAYGARWLHAFSDIMEEIPCNQIDEAIERLENDDSDRRVWITSYHPVEDLVKTGQKTVPCPVGFSLSVMDGQLCSSLMIRSSDLYFGLPYDVMRHALLMAALASTMGIGLGYMRVTLAHPHIYRTQWGHVNGMLSNPVSCPKIMMPIAGMEKIVNDPDAYVETVKAVCEAVPEEYWPTYIGKSEVVR